LLGYDGAHAVNLRSSPRRWIVALAGLAVAGLARPRGARAQAEEAPPEPATVQGDVAPAAAVPESRSDSAALAPGAGPPASPGAWSRVVFIPYVGFSAPVGDGWAGFNVSPRFGALLGWQATEKLSLNAECDLDYARPEQNGGIRFDEDANRPSFWSGFWDPPRQYVDFTLSPLVSLRAGQIRLGPKLGWFESRGSDQGLPATGAGVAFGFNVGLFVPHRAVTLAGLFSGTFRAFTSTSEPYGAHHTLGLLAALLL
jgi:hypothetical protein